VTFYPSPAFAVTDKRHRSRDAAASELCQRQSQEQTSEPDLRQMAPAVAAGCHHDHAPQAKKEKESGTP
jgi:hypothetical protein